MSQEKRTYSERRAYLLQAVSLRRRRIKERAVAFKGGACETCGYSAHLCALDFHHLDPATKSFSIGAQGHSRSWERVEAELNKCILVCANCHREITAGLREVKL